MNQGSFSTVDAARIVAGTVAQQAVKMISLIKEASLPTITEILQVDGLFTFAAELGMQSSIRILTTTGFFRDVLSVRILRPQEGPVA